MAQEDILNVVAFSPDGSFLATGSNDDTARVWEAATGRLLGTMVHNSWVVDVEFSPDGTLLATASRDGFARMWRVESGQEVARLPHDSWVFDVEFSPDGKLLATASRDRTAVLWTVTPDDLITEACSRLSRNLTFEEWQRFIGDEPYRPSCDNLPGISD